MLVNGRMRRFSFVMKISFADCVLDAQAFTLERDGEAVDVEPQVFDLLLALAKSPGVVLTREDLIEAVWGGRIVSDSAISARISAARTSSRRRRERTADHPDLAATWISVCGQRNRRRSTGGSVLKRAAHSLCHGG